MAIDPSNARVARRLGAYDLALIVMGSVIGSGIFRTPSIVAGRVHSAPLTVWAWIAGGAITLFGAFVLGELAARRPDGCGPYAYLRDAFHPLVAFAYGWTSLLASFTGGIAAAAVLFSGYLLALTGWTLSPALVAALAIVALALVNALGVRQGSNVQGALTVLKVAALLALIVAGAFAKTPRHLDAGAMGLPLGAAAGFALALVPILFTYNGAIVANFMAGEAHDASTNLPFGLAAGIGGVALLFVLVNVSYVHVLGVALLARTPVPASAVAMAVVGPAGAKLVALAIAVSTLGLIGNRLLTVPRLYHAMAADGLFFRSVGSIDPRTRVPVVAIGLQAVLAIAIVLSGGYEHILNYVVATFYIFNGLLAVALFVIRKRDDSAPSAHAGFRVPLHPVSTAIYLLLSFGVAAATCIADPRDGLAGLAIVLSSIPAYALWRWRTR